MSYRDVLGRICQLFKSDADAHLEDIKGRLRGGRLKPPAQPMSDQELAWAIKEFRSAEMSDWTRQRPAKRQADVSAPTACKPTAKGGQSC